ncbi:MAG: M48 family metallopeptidase [Acidobacteria bacterium]|nr:M48 family metallopeptidase [Acidobacteriota bacterium]MCB9398038.1 M48 family metallopeptidase [Acidobacteriota bacterium]
MSPTYSAVAYDPDISGVAQGNLVIQSSNAVFWGQAGEFSLPLKGLRLRLGGQDDFLFLEHSDFLGRSFATQDRAVLSDPNLLSFPELVDQIQGIGRHKHKRLRGWLIFLAIGALGIASLFPLRTWLVFRVTEAVPRQWEQDFGQALWDQMASELTVLTDAELQGQLDRLVQPLLRTTDDADAFQFHIIADESINAFALPGGHIAIHSGLILEARRPEEILGVLGHEMAHVQRRHSLRALVQQTGNQVLITAVLGNLDGISHYLLANSAFLLNQSFSRSQEAEADRIGLETLRNAELDPTALLDFFEILQEQEKRLGGAPPAFLNSHPATHSRMEALRKQIQTAPPAEVRHLDFDLAAFQTLVQEQASTITK